MLERDLISNADIWLYARANLGARTSPPRDREDTYYERTHIDDSASRRCLPYRSGIWGTEDLRMFQA